MQLGVISDTHGEVLLTANAVELFQSFGVDEVIHCGDIGAQSVLDQFVKIPTHFVFGNCDTQRDLLRQAITRRGMECHESFGSMEREGKKIAFLHSDDQSRYEQSIASQKWDLICYGHSHEAMLSTHGRTRVLNPGALHNVAEPTVAVIALPEMDVLRLRV